MSEFLKRPTSSETDDDLQKMQEEWERTKNQQKPTVEIHRMKKRSKIEENPEILAQNQPKIEETQNPAQNSNLAPKIREQAARFQLDLEESSDATGVLFPVREQNSEIFNFKLENLAGNSNLDYFQYSKDDGFPEPLDLSAYYKSGRSLTTVVQKGKSFFAAEFDRIHGRIEENLDLQAENQEEEGSESKNSGDFKKENEKYLKSLEPEKIQDLMSEIKERFDPKLLEFLKNRGAEKSKKSDTEQPVKISKFKASRQKKGAELPVEKGAEPPVEKEKGAEPAPTKEVEEMMNELEVLDEWAGQEDQEKYNRLATDAIQLDLTAKFSRNLAQRQQKNAVKLFDNCKFKPDTAGPSDAILELARSSIDHIKTLYLEEISDGHTTSYEFGKGVNPIIDNCWTLIPARRVLDAVEKRQGQVSPDDVEIVRLAVRWTYILWAERKSAFFAFAEPNDFYVHLAELYLIGPEILADDVISECTQRILNGYVLPQALQGKISLRMSGKVAGLDAFMPFYEQMLKNYEQYSMGDAHFTEAILIGAYLNAPVGDSIEYRFSLWSPKRNTIRQMTVSTSKLRPLFDGIKKQIVERHTVIQEQHYVQYCSLLGAYVTAIRDDVITRDRNQLLFDIAAFEIGNFVEMQKKSTEKRREFQILVDIMQKSIGDKLRIF